jgi:cell division transport system ATP-binding protein
VNVLGKELGKLKGRQLVKLRRSVGVVWQDFKLIHDLTVFENVALALRVRQVNDDQVKAKVRETLEEVGLKDRERFFPSELAGGELQRCCLARAVVGQPRILLADEPTGNLDPDTSWQIMKLLKMINKQGTTVLMATHNSEIVNSMRQRVIHLDAGKVIKDEEKGKYGK